MPRGRLWARLRRALAPLLVSSLLTVVATAGFAASAEPSLVPLRAALATPEFHGVAAVRPPPPKGPHRLGTAEVWAPLTTIATAMAGPAPVAVGVITMLHGACGAPMPVCATFSEEVIHDSPSLDPSPRHPDRDSTAPRSNWVVCPMGNAVCDDGGLDWRGSGDEKAAHLEAIRDEVDARYAGLMGDREILAGFSRGAFVARDVAYARPHRYRALILIGAAASLDPRRLLDSGIERVALVSGRYDGARPTMVAMTARLSATGLPARFFDAGPIHHELPRDMGRLMAEIVAWIDG